MKIMLEEVLVYGREEREDDVLDYGLWRIMHNFEVVLACFWDVGF